MKVVHVETGMNLYGGAQQVAYILDGLARRGVHNVLVCPPGAAIGAHFRGSPIPVIESRCGGDLDLGFVARLRAVLRAQAPDLVHLHSRRGADVLGGIAARWAGVPAVLSRRVDNPEAAWWARRKYAPYARVICISEGIAGVLRAEGVPEEKLRVVRSAVVAEPWTKPEARARFLEEFALPADAIAIGIVAQLIERKGHRVLFAALKQLAESAKLRLLVFGQGALRPALESEARALGLAGTVRFVGFRKDLARWMGNLDLLVHPAYMEGLGVSLLQASAAGVPIVASRAGGIPEAVRDGVNGLLVPPGDADALAQALHRLLDDAPLRRRLGDGGRRLVAEVFSPEAMVAGNLAVYEELLAPS